MLTLGRKAVTNLDSVLKDRVITLPTNARKVKAMFFPVVRCRWKSSTIKKAECWRTDLFELSCWRMEKTLESPLGCKEIQPVNPKGNQPWIFSGRTDAEAPVLWPPDEKSQLIGKQRNNNQSNKQKTWSWEILKAGAEGMTEDGMVGWYQQLNGMSLSKLQETVMDRAAWHTEVHRVTGSQTRLSNWTSKARQGLSVQVAEPQ